MNARPRALGLALAATVVIGLLGGCQTTSPPNQGQSGYRVNPTRDAPSEWGSQDLRSKDLVTATDKMAQDIATRLDISSRSNPPRIVVGQIENESSRFNRNYQVFLTRLQSVLLASGQRHGLQIYRERDFVETQRAREFGDKMPDRSADAYLSDAEYVLTCVVQDLPSGGTDYYLLSYQLVQLVDVAASGPDVGPGAIVWSNFYEVKYQ